ncbi:hypothethical protein [Ralstonia solanacearum PSI07]|nr:hypothethical protein [Ralstonia solanacearum PSI07]
MSVPDRAALTHILFVLKTGLRWSNRPAEMGCGLLLDLLAQLASRPIVFMKPSLSSGELTRAIHKLNQAPIRHKELVAIDSRQQYPQRLHTSLNILCQIC